MNNSNEVEALKEEILNLSKKIDELKEKEISKDLMNELKDITQKLDIESLKQHISEEKIEKLKEKSTHIINEIEEFTKNHPVASLLAAFGAGCLIGKILK